MRKRWRSKRKMPGQTALSVQTWTLRPMLAKTPWLSVTVRMRPALPILLCWLIRLRWLILLLVPMQQWVVICVLPTCGRPTRARAQLSALLRRRGLCC
jgi:hypothetical protein